MWGCWVFFLVVVGLFLNSSSVKYSQFPGLECISTCKYCYYHDMLQLTQPRHSVSSFKWALDTPIPPRLCLPRCAMAPKDILPGSIGFGWHKSQLPPSRTTAVPRQNCSGEYFCRKSNDLILKFPPKSLFSSRGYFWTKPIAVLFAV